MPGSCPAAAWSWTAGRSVSGLLRAGPPGNFGPNGCAPALVHPRRGRPAPRHRRQQGHAKPALPPSRGSRTSEDHHPGHPLRRRPRGPTGALRDRGPRRQAVAIPKHPNQACPGVFPFSFTPTLVSGRAGELTFTVTCNGRLRTLRTLHGHPTHRHTAAAGPIVPMSVYGGILAGCGGGPGRNGRFPSWHQPDCRRGTRYPELPGQPIRPQAASVISSRSCSSSCPRSCSVHCMTRAPSSAMTHLPVSIVPTSLPG